MAGRCPGEEESGCDVGRRKKTQSPGDRRVRRRRGGPPFDFFPSSKFVNLFSIIFLFLSFDLCAGFPFVAFVREKSSGEVRAWGLAAGGVIGELGRFRSTSAAILRNGMVYFVGCQGTACNVWSTNGTPSGTAKGGFLSPLDPAVVSASTVQILSLEQSIVVSTFGLSPPRTWWADGGVFAWLPSGVARGSQMRVLLSARDSALVAVLRSSSSWWVMHLTARGVTPIMTLDYFITHHNGTAMWYNNNWHFGLSNGSYTGGVDVLTASTLTFTLGSAGASVKGFGAWDPCTGDTLREAFTYPQETFSGSPVLVDPALFLFRRPVNPLAMDPGVFVTWNGVTRTTTRTIPPTLVMFNDAFPLNSTGFAISCTDGGVQDLCVENGQALSSVGVKQILEAAAGEILSVSATSALSLVRHANTSRSLFLVDTAKTNSADRVALNFDAFDVLQTFGLANAWVPPPLRAKMTFPCELKVLTSTPTPTSTPQPRPHTRTPTPTPTTTPTPTPTPTHTPRTRPPIFPPVQPSAPTPPSAPPAPRESEGDEDHDEFWGTMWKKPNMQWMIPAVIGAALGLLLIGFLLGCCCARRCAMRATPRKVQDAPETHLRIPPPLPQTHTTYLPTPANMMPMMPTIPAPPMIAHIVPMPEWGDDVAMEVPDQYSETWDYDSFGFPDGSVSMPSVSPHQSPAYHSTYGVSNVNEAYNHYNYYK